MKTKILIIRFSSIGDIVLTSPVVRCIKQQMPDVELHFLTKTKYSELVHSNPYIDKIHLYEEKLKEIIPALQEEKFTYIIDLHRNIRSLTVKRSLRAKSFSFNKLNIRKFLLIQFRINIMPDKHIVDRMFEAISDLGVKNDGKGLDFFFPDSNDYSEKLPLDYKKGYVAVVLASSFFTKRFPAEKHLEYIEKAEVPFVLLGGNEELELADTIEEKAEEKVLNLCNKLSIGESASIVKNASLVIANDTGLMHIAAAFKKKILSIWGSTTPVLGMYPYQANPLSARLQVGDLSCQPCSKIGKRKCPKGHFKCMEQQNTREVVQWIETNFPA